MLLTVLPNIVWAVASAGVGVVEQVVLVVVLLVVPVGTLSPFISSRTGYWLVPASWVDDGPLVARLVQATGMVGLGLIMVLAGTVDPADLTGVPSVAAGYVTLAALVLPVSVFAFVAYFKAGRTTNGDVDVAELRALAPSYGAQLLLLLVAVVLAGGTL